MGRGRSRFVARVAPLALLLLIPGLAELHTTGGAHSEAIPRTVAYFPGAEHPNQPLHVEPGKEAAQPECPACLHRLETRGGSPAAKTSTEVPVESPRAIGGGASSPSTRPGPTCRGRAPPTLF